MIVESAVIVSLALLIDLVFGDPKNKFHPTAWIGTLIARLVPVARSNSRTYERTAGVFVVLIPVSVVVSFLFLVETGLGMLTGLVSIVASILVVGVLLKTTIAVKGMERCAMMVVAALEEDDLPAARERLSMLVKRDTKNLDKDHIYSALMESISENTVDGVTGPLFYFGFFGIFGSFVYRTVNTADSMVGYKTRLFRNIGWFAATSDSILNFVPSRLTGMTMILSSILLRNNWRKSYHVMIRDGRKTESPNAGYPMAAMAGALDARLEKINHYSIGDGTVHFSKRHVYSTITLMKVTSIIFAMMVVVPAIAFMSYLGLWIHA